MKLNKNRLAKVVMGMFILSGSLFTFTSCSDFFEPSPDNIVSTDDYIQKENQMYKGMLGIMNAMHAAGDHAIFLTDTRCNIIDVTTNAPVALQNICNYEETDGNEYADPTVYYSVIIAVNDFISKMQEYKLTTGGMTEVGESSFKPLISSALRIKVWAYWMLGRIYGEAYWFDSPLTEKTPLTDSSVFTHCDMQQLTEKCLNLLENGIMVAGMNIPANLDMQWYTWLNQKPVENDAELENKRETYKQWQYLVPPYLLLHSELLSWRCNYKTEEEAQTDWLQIRNDILDFMYGVHTATSVSDLMRYGVYGFAHEDDLVIPNTSSAQSFGALYQMDVLLQSSAPCAYYTLFCNEEVKQHFMVISALQYSHINNQRNRLVQYFCPEYPDAESYYLKPSDYAINGLYSPEDLRSISQKFVMNTLGGQPAVTKYYYGYDSNTSVRDYKYLRDKIYEIQPIIVLFRGQDLHFLLAEAENHLGNWDQAYTIFNVGFMNRFADKVLPTDPSVGCTEAFDTRYSSWLGSTGGNGNIGLVGVMNGEKYNLPYPTAKQWTNMSDAEKKDFETARREATDWALAQEYAKEYLGEGKSYSYLCKMVERYSHAGRGNASAAADKMADIISPKYDAAKAAKVRSSLRGKYFINWNLNK